MRRSTALALLAKSLKGIDQRTTTCVELACGTGQLAREVMRNFPRLRFTALDMSPPYAAAAAKALSPYRSATAISGAAEATPFDSARVDRVLCVYLFHELPPKIRKAVVTEAARILKPGGIFVLADALQTGDDPNLDRLLDAFPVGFHEPFFSTYLTTDLTALFDATGFDFIEDAQAFLTKGWMFQKRGG
jgi:ubiquinone/menaquinone biosynthesis C-methylase UbiE